MKKNAKGICLCGSVTMSLVVENETFDACHCGMCRKWNGGPTLTVETAPEATFSGEEFITTFNSSDWAERAFCNKCGTHLFYRLKATGVRYVPLGVIENNEHYQFKVQIFVDRKPAYYDFANETQQMTETEVFAKFSS